MKTINKFNDYLLLGGIIFIICLIVFKPWQHALSLPYTYQSDSHFTQMFIKNQITSGKFWYSNQLSLPGEQNMLDFPSAQVFLYGLITFIGLFTKNHFLIFNIFFLSGFFLSGFSAYFVLRQMKFNKYYSYLSALVFSFLPYHFAHGSIHIFLSHYFVIPLAFLISYWILFSKTVKHQLWWVLLIGILIGSNGIYYAYFSCLLTLFSFFIIGLQKRITKQNLMLGSLFIVTTVVMIAMQLLPSIKYWAQHGKNNAVGHRVPAEAVLYGIKLRQLFIPLHDYNLSFLKEFTREYKETPSSDMENRQYLGLIGIFSVMICGLIFFDVNVLGKKSLKKENVHHYLSIKNWYFIFMMLVLVSMSYGGASMIAHIITPKIRAYGRIVPLLNFSLIIIVLLFLQSWREKIKQRKVFTFIVSLIFALSIFDGLKAYNPIKTRLIDDFYSDKNFMKQIENNLPQGSAVYQLPYKDFPETPNLHKIGSYELFKGYLHSKDLKWSYGSLVGRHVAGWQYDLSTKEPEEQLELMLERDFNGLYIDTYGYKDEGVSIVASFSAILNSEPLVSEDKRLVFFDLTDY